MRQKLFNVFLTCLFFLATTTAAFAQQTVKVTGKVIDSTNEGVPGVNVQVKGGSSGTITDVNGNYKIDVPSSKSVLVFSFIGYEKQEVAVGNKTVINVTLKDDTQLLDEVVVVAYGTARKGDLTGALTNMKPDANDAAKAISIDGLLEGKVAGLVVSSASSSVGAASSVTIRGASSLRGDNQPLYVIDNVPQASTGEFGQSAISGDFQIAQDPLSSLNPADIEDITILKDASSTAIYGSRGANGVILITTKKGKEGKAKVNVAATFTIANATRLLDVVGLDEYAEYQNSRITDGFYPFYKVGDEMRYVYNDKLKNYDPNDPETYNLVYYRNWQKEIYKSAFSQNYSVSVNGGSNKTTYYISANFKDINGTVKQTGLKQGDLRANLTAQLSKAVKLDLSLSGALRQNDMMAGGNTLGGSTGAISRTALDYSPFEKPDDDPTLTNENKTNVFSWLNDYVDITDDKTFKGSMNLTWKISKFLSYSLRAGGNVNINNRKRWYGLELYQGMNNDGYLAQSDLSKSNYTIENILNYNTKLGKVGKLDATVGVTYDDYNFLNKNVTGDHFTMFEFRENGLHMAGNTMYGTPTQKDYQLLSYLGRVNVSLYDKYLITASIRADGSSKFAKSNRWGYFPSGSVAWRMEQEEFLKDVSWLNQLKARVSYGVTGNQAIDPYATIPTYGQLTNPIYYSDGSGNLLTTMIVNGMANDALKWEQTASWNFGVDFSLFKSRLSGTVDYYIKKTQDLLISKPMPGSIGFANTYFNQGDMKNQGVEFSLNAQIIDTKDWKWSLSGNIGVNKSEITSLGMLPVNIGCLKDVIGYEGATLGDHFGTANVFLQGEAPGLFFGYATQGIVQPEDITKDGVKYIKSDGTEGTYKKALNKNPSAGDVKFVDQNGDGLIDANDRTIIGDPNPDFTYGFQTRISWRSLSLSASFNGVQGRDIMNTGIRYTGTPGIKSNNIVRKAFLGMWTEENHSNLYPSSTYTVENGVVMDRYVEDGSYLRCSDITLSYTLPKNWMKAIGFKNTMIYASVKNAFVITDYSGYDPEVNSFAFDGLRPGIDMNSYPNPRSFIFGLNVTF